MRSKTSKIFLLCSAIAIFGTVAVAQVSDALQVLMSSKIAEEISERLLEKMGRDQMNLQPRIFRDATRGQNIDREAMRSIVPNREVLTTLYTYYSGSVCQKLRAQPMRTPLPQLAREIRKHSTYMGEMISFIERVGEKKIVDVVKDLQSGAYQEMLKKYVRLSDELGRNSGKNQAQISTWFRIETMEDKFYREGLAGARDFKVEDLQGFSQPEQEVIKLAFYLGGRKAYLYSILGVPAVANYPASVDVRYHPIYGGYTESFVLRRCLEANTANRSCLDISKKWKEMLDGFANLLSRACRPAT